MTKTFLKKFVATFAAVSIGLLGTFGKAMADEQATKKAPKQVETQMVVILDDETGEAIRGVDAKTGADKGKIMIAAEKEQGWLQQAVIMPFAYALPKEDFRKNGVQMLTPVPYGKSYLGAAGAFISDVADGAMAWAALKLAYAWAPDVFNLSNYQTQQAQGGSAYSNSSTGPIDVKSYSTSAAQADSWSYSKANNGNKGPSCGHGFGNCR